MCGIVARCFVSDLWSITLGRVWFAIGHDVFNDVRLLMCDAMVEVQKVRWFETDGGEATTQLELSLAKN